MIKQLAYSNNYKTLDGLLTFLRGSDLAVRQQYSKNISVKEGSKIMCFNCNDTGHKKNYLLQNAFSKI